MKVVTIDEMREIEHRAETEHGLASPILMEYAGRSIAEILREHLGGDVRGRNVLVLVGPGNNGGDGRVMARYLAEWGAETPLYIWKERLLESNGQSLPVVKDLAALAEAIQKADVVADAFLGTGHSRPLDPSMGAALALVQREKQRRPELLILAVDLPSGLNADTGGLDAGAIAAGLTVTLAFPKVGLFLFPGAGYIGELRVGSIGLPPTMCIEVGMELVDAELLRPLLPKRPLDSNKGTFGKVMVLAGSSAYIGAAYLATAAAARIGSGLVSLATTRDRARFYAAMLPEATYVLLPPDSTSAQKRVHALLDHLNGYHALIVGPGLGQSAATHTLLGLLFDGLRALPESARPRLIVDADGLNDLAHSERWWELLPAHTVLTPHPGEMSRLLGGTKVSGGGLDRLEVARWFKLGTELEATSAEEAQRAYRRALEIDPNIADAHLNLGKLCHEAGELDEAETHYRAAARLASREAAPYFNLGVLLEDLKRPREAVDCYKESLTRDSDFADAHYNLGLLLENLGNKTEAFTHLRAARKLYIGK